MASDVKVVNTAAKPVPVTGTVKLTGTPSVKVVGLHPKWFSVPLFLEQRIPGPGGANAKIIRANLTLPQPALLESIAINCGGRASAVLLSVDGGPLGTAGVTAVVGTPDSALVLGLSVVPLSGAYTFNLLTKANGDSYLPVTRIGVPITSSFELSVFPLAGQTFNAQCTVNFVFRRMS